jgi:hypothetical protein
LKRAGEKIQERNEIDQEQAEVFISVFVWNSLVAANYFQ